MAPSGLLVTNIGMQSAVLNWSVSTGNFYTVDYKAATSGTWINAASGISNGNISLQNLVPSTIYDWRVSANCSAVSIANYSTGQFTTSSHNDQITDLRDGYGIKISPNPVTGRAIVDYIIAESGNYSIEIINPQGQRLQSLLNSRQVAGQYQFIITQQLDKLSKGVYFLVLTQNNRAIL
ncbi:MAG: T9SS type A sorting domain-containing protein [Chitinophagaceae bacterium]|nr:T9SS type A sorting domain-containing protein [Chitinophagaceae bacterium]